MILGFVGTFPERFGLPPSETVHVLDVDPATGHLTTLQITNGLVNPSFVALHPTLARLYAVERDWSSEDATSGALTTFEIAPDGRLSRSDRTRSGGRFSSHVSVNPLGTRLFVANPRSASVSAFTLGSEGLPDSSASAVRSTAMAGSQTSQNGPWTHSAFVDTEERRVFACDFGSDCISIYDLDARGKLVPSVDSPLAANPGSGPRHLAFHPNGRYFYVVNERDSTISIYAKDSINRRFALLESISTVPERGTNQPAEIRVTDRFIYCSNRGHDSIVSFAIEDSGERIRPVSWQASGGAGPRHFAIDSQRGLALVANQRSGSVVSFWLDDRRGALVPTGHRIDVPNASCIAIAEMPPSRREVA